MLSIKDIRPIGPPGAAHFLARPGGGVATDQMPDIAVHDVPDASELRRRESAALLAVAQAEYDRCDSTAPLGIRIAHALRAHLQTLGLRAAVVRTEIVSQPYVVLALRDGVYMLEIPYQYYLRGAALTWQRVAGVRFSSAHLSLERLDGNANKLGCYVDCG
jgi:hypothetical protein